MTQKGRVFFWVGAALRCGALVLGKKSTIGSRSYYIKVAFVGWEKDEYSKGPASPNAEVHLVLSGRDTYRLCLARPLGWRP